MKRWCFYDDGGREEDPNGEWVRWDDVKDLLIQPGGDHCDCGCHQTGSLCMECCEGGPK